MIYVLAHTRVQYDRFRFKSGLGSKSFVFVTDLHMLLGVYDHVMIRLRGWEQRFGITDQERIAMLIPHYNWIVLDQVAGG